MKNKPTTKTRRRITTIDDILATDSVNEILEKIIKEKANIGNLIVIYTDKRDDTYHCQTSENTTFGQAITLLEEVKFDWMSSEE